MNHVSIFEKKWLDLVFDGKNKEYGAYRLRLENPRTTLTAFVYGLMFLSGVAIILALSSFSAKHDVVPDVNDDKLHVTNVEIARPKQLENEAPPAESPKPKNNLPPVVAPTPDPDPDPEPTPNTVPNTPTAGIPGAGTAPSAPGTGPATTPGPELPIENLNPVAPYALDILPVYRPGMSEFYKEVARTFNRPEIDDMKTARVIVSFVIEKDGTLSDIKVIRDPGYGMGKEAIRVLKSLKEKWDPGLVKGKPVRTLYTLPITVDMRE